MIDGTESLGNITIAHRAIASITYQCAIQSYGVVGLAPKNLAEGLAHALVKDPALGVDVQFDGDRLEINLYIIIEYGTRIKSVASSVAESVRYQVEKMIGLPVSEINIHIRGMRVSDPD